MFPCRFARPGVEGKAAHRSLGRPAIQKGCPGHIRSPVEVAYGMDNPVSSRGQGEAESGGQVMDVRIRPSFPSKPMQDGRWRFSDIGFRPFHGVHEKLDLDGVSEGRISTLPQVKRLVCGNIDKQRSGIHSVTVPRQAGVVGEGFPLVGFLGIGPQSFRCGASCQNPQGAHRHDRCTHRATDPHEGRGIVGCRSHEGAPHATAIWGG